MPVYLASVGPRNLELTGEIADGWLAIFFSPEHAAQSLDAVRAGRRRAGRGATDDALAGFDVVPTVPVVIDDDVERAAMPVRPYAALYVGGMGSRQQNFYNALAVRMGYEREAREVQDLFLDRKHRDAAMAVPLSFIDQTSLIGPRDRIRDRLGAYADAGVTTLSISVYHGDLESRLRDAAHDGRAARRVRSGGGGMSSGIGYGDGLILGVVEGITEFLPISSTGHLTIAEGLLNLKTDSDQVTAFTAVVQMGAILAAVLFFRRDIIRIIVAVRPRRRPVPRPGRSSTGDWRSASSSARCRSRSSVWRCGMSSRARCATSGSSRLR